MNFGEASISSIISSISNRNRLYQQDIICFD